MLYRTDHLKPDGRRAWLYSDAPMASPGSIPVPSPDPVAVATHMRWHPLLGEWVLFASHRQDRTFLPSSEDDPLAPTRDATRPTELPAGDYKVAVFENRFPALAAFPGAPPEVPGVETLAALGRSEVLVFSQDDKTSLGHLPAPDAALILQVMADRTRDMESAGLRYVLPFENRGEEMGVTLHHPHAQIYGYGFVPDYQDRVGQRLAGHQRKHGHDLVVDMAVRERKLGIRLVAARNHAIAFVPAFARFPFETWLIPSRPAPDLASLADSEIEELASLLQEVLQRLDAVWQRPMPYLLTVNQAPPDRDRYPGWSVRIEIWPIRRAANKLKFLAGTELGTGVFTSDSSPEDAAAKLRSIIL